MSSRPANATAKKVPVSERARKPGQSSSWCRYSTRMAYYLRGGFACVYCQRGAESGAVLSLDHVVPSVYGGQNTPDNLLCACVSCNSARQDLPLQDFLAMLGDKGVDVDMLTVRIQKQLNAPLDRSAGVKLAKARRPSYTSN